LIFIIIVGLYHLFGYTGHFGFDDIHYAELAADLPALVITLTILIIVSLENSTGTYFWKALEIDRYIKAYSNWRPVKFNITIPQKDQKSASRLKVYVWNSDNQKVYIDNFGIKIIEKPVP
jgi:hypothetical protein